MHNALARKPKRIRTAFSPSQLLRLEHAFEKNHYVVGAERKQLAHSLSLTETQVRNTTSFFFNFTCAFILFCFLVYNAIRKSLHVSIDRFNFYSKETFLILMLMSWNICDIFICFVFLWVMESIKSGRCKINACHRMTIVET